MGEGNFSHNSGLSLLLVQEFLTGFSGFFRNSQLVLKRPVNLPKLPAKVCVCVCAHKQVSVEKGSKTLVQILKMVRVLLETTGLTVLLRENTWGRKMSSQNKMKLNWAVT